MKEVQARMSKTKTHEKIKMFIKEHLPIGYRPEKERTAFLTSLICPVIFSLTFLVNYSREKENLYRYIAGGFRKELIPGAVMENFADVLGYSMTAFPAFALICLLSQLFSHYAYHKNGSNAFYTMRRLPDNHELRRRCVTLPLMEAGVILLTMAVMLGLYYSIYMCATPDECIRPGQWSFIWEKWRVF